MEEQVSLHWILCACLCVSVCICYVFLQINVNSGTVPSVSMDINFECMSDSSLVLYVSRELEYIKTHPRSSN